jgi:hypothetical protein
MQDIAARRGPVFLVEMLSHPAFDHSSANLKDVVALYKLIVTNIRSPEMSGVAALLAKIAERPRQMRVLTDYIRAAHARNVVSEAVPWADM